MRIEVTKVISPLERERYEFHVRIISRGIYIDFIKFVSETRPTSRHKIYQVQKIWAHGNWATREFVRDRIVDRPSVPVGVAFDVQKKVNSATHYEFVVSN